VELANGLQTWSSWLRIHRWFLMHIRGISGDKTKLTVRMTQKHKSYCFRRKAMTLQSQHNVQRHENTPITVAAPSTAWIVFARSNTGIAGSNPTRGMDICVRLFCVCVVLCVGSGLATGWHPVQEVLPNVYRLKNWKSGQGPQGLCRVIDKRIVCIIHTIS
jgi:hypothetical protein